MSNPIIAEVTRGPRVESIHRGSYHVCDSSGAIIASVGEVQAPVYARSALKLLQAVPVVESGAADALQMTEAELAIICASHSSEDGHVETVTNLLGKAGLEPEACLQCGAHWPLFRQKDTVDFAKAGKMPRRVHNNCSGKHSGFLCTCVHTGAQIDNYIDGKNEVQRHVRALVGDLTGRKIEDDCVGFDGCSAPTFAVPLDGLALAVARLASGSGLPESQASAGKRLAEACMAEPWHVAGTGRFCTRIMEAGKGKVYAKLGAEGVYVAALPEQGIGIAMKADDGAFRAVEVKLASMIADLIEDEARASAIRELSTQAVNDWNGNPVGAVRSV